jgi:5-methylcytosine-specific restriction endonuclease McrA
MNLQHPDKCWYCGSQLFGKKKKHPVRHRLTFDHQTPRCRGGTAVAEDGSKNLVKACAACNLEKGSLTVEEFRAVVAIREGYLKDVRQYWTFHGEAKTSD